MCWHAGVPSHVPGPHVGVCDLQNWVHFDVEAAMLFCTVPSAQRQSSRQPDPGSPVRTKLSTHVPQLSSPFVQNPPWPSLWQTSESGLSQSPFVFSNCGKMC